MLESAVHPDDRWTVFARPEAIRNDELLDAPAGTRVRPYPVGKVGVGVIRDFRLVPHLKFGVGAQAARNFVGDLTQVYGGDRWGGMDFVRLKLD